MDDAQFWQLIETSRTGNADCDAQAARLTNLLAQLPPGEIATFDTLLYRHRREAYRWDLWGAAYLINGGCSDDGFEYFCCWLIGQGKQAYEAALADPDSLSGLIQTRRRTLERGRSGWAVPQTGVTLLTRHQESELTRVDLPLTENANTEIALLLALLDDTTQECTSELDEVPDAGLAWRPFPGGHSIGALLLHIADVEAYWLHEIGAGQTRSPEERQALLSDETQQYQVQWPTPPAHPLAWYREQLARTRARSRELVLAINDPDQTGQRGDETFTLRWLLGHVVSHEAYHGGQAVLLALMQTR